MTLKPFARYAWFVLLANLIVILWGAYVRASGSGAGCGSHWPLCNGAVIPRAPRIETMIEFAHRLSSGFVFLLVVGLVVWAYRVYPRGNPVRLAASLSMLFMVTEALVGAGLVLFEWVAQNASLGRVISLIVHLINTFMLLASLTLTGWWASLAEGIPIKGQRKTLWRLAFGYLGVLFLGITGAIAALGDTLFPAGSLTQGLQQDFSATAHFLIRLRIWHPLVAILVGVYVILVTWVIGHSWSNAAGKRLSSILTVLIAVQLIAGLINVLLLAPIWMQIIHLLLADLVWIGLVLFGAANMTVYRQLSST